MRNIGVVTTSRADYGIYLPVLRRIQDEPTLSLNILVSGMHLLPEFGSTVNNIEADGFDISDRVEISLSSDTPEGVAEAMGHGVIGFAKSFARSKPDILLVVSTTVYGQRVVQMGEEPWRGVISGAPSLDNIKTLDLLSKTELEQAFDLDLSKPTLLVTYHPVTLQYENTEHHTREILSSLSEVDFNIVLTYPNADTHGKVIIELINRFVEQQENAWVVANLGTQAYFSLMSHVAAMVGNSSSGIIEAASFQLPVVNIGDRQLGRIRSGNVIDVNHDKNSILTGIAKATTTEFHHEIETLPNCYGDGGASERIVKKLNAVPLDRKLLMKRFYSITETAETIAVGLPNGN